MTEQYICGDCGKAREKEEIEFKEHDNPKLGKFPICIDTNCSIDNVADPTNTYKIDTPLE